MSLNRGRELSRRPVGPRRGYRLKIVPAMTMMRSRATWEEAGYAVLRLPASAIAVTLNILTSGGGNAEVTGTTGAVTLSSGSGNITIR